MSSDYGPTEPTFILCFQLLLALLLGLPVWALMAHTGAQGCVGCHPSSGINNHSKVIGAGAQPLTLDQCSTSEDTAGRVSEGLWSSLAKAQRTWPLMFSLPKNKLDEILCQMVWPDFCLGNLDKKGQQRASGPGMAACWAEDNRRSACPGYYRGPQRSEQEKKPDLKETKVRQGRLGLSCREWGPRAVRPMVRGESQAPLP